MAQDRPGQGQLVWMGLVLVLVLVVVGRFVFQWLTAPEEEPPPASFEQQVEALPFVEEVRTETDRVVGSPQVRTLESWITLASGDVVSDPAGVAEGLSGVTWGYSPSHWSVEGLPSTADVNHPGPVAQEPLRWWTESVAALADADPQAALHCDIRTQALRCEVDTADPGRALQALTGVDGSRIEPWLARVTAQDEEEKGFSLTVDGQTFTDATTLG